MLRPDSTTFRGHIRPWAQLAGLAVIYYAVTGTIWAFLPRYNPITQWLLETYAGTDDNLYYVLVNTHDAIVNVLLALPIAYLITRIRPDRRWLFVAAIVLAMFLWDYRLVLFERRDFFDFILSSNQAFVGFILYVLYLPFAMFFVSVFERRKLRDLPHK